MSEDWTPPARPVFRSANPYSSLVDDEPDDGVGLPVWTWTPPGAEQPAAATHGPLPAPPRPAARPAPPPPARRRFGTATIATSLVVAGLLSVGLGALLARATSHSGPAPSSLTGPAATGPSIAGAGSAMPTPEAPAPTPTPAATPPPLSLAAIEARVDPAVVDITATIPDQDIVAEGTGMVVSPSGEVLTNDHVVAGASRISVLIGGRGKSYRARIVGADSNQDVAVLQVEGAPSGLATVTVGDSSSVALGDSVVVLGNAGGHQGKPAASTGTVSALDQTVTATDAGGDNAETLTGLIQVDATVQPGDSGGPLLDDQARVIGMATAASGRHASSPQGYAIPIGTAVDVASQITGSG